MPRTVRLRRWSFGSILMGPDCTGGSLRASASSTSISNTVTSRMSGFVDYVPVPRKYRSPSMPRPATKFASASSSILAEAASAIWIWRSRPPRHWVLLVLSSASSAISIGPSLTSLEQLAITARPAAGLLRGFDSEAFLLARICNVADGGALHVALPAQVVELRSTVHRAAIVPNDQVVDAPAMRVNELTLRGVRDELVDQCATIVLGHSEDAARV